MKPLPMPIRIAAGLVATALEEMQELPRKLTELPVTAVSQALQVSMRLQQRVTELAIKGDRALGALRPVPETPAWARFDEDEEADRGPRHNGLRGGLSVVDSPRPPKVTPVRVLPDPEPDEVSEVPVPRPPVEPATTASATDETSESDVASAAEPSAKATPKAEDTAGAPASEAGSAEDTSRPEPSAAAISASAKPKARRNARSTTGASGDDSASLGDTATTEVEAAPHSDAARNAKASQKAKTGENAGGEKADGPAKAGAETGPPGLPEYESWTLPQLRGRFRALSLEQLQQLLDWETSHQDRPPYVTMLSNRIASVSGR